MRKRLRPISIVVAVALAAWVGAAFYRQARIRSEVLRRIGSNYAGHDVRVPIVPLLKNPFRSDPKVYLFQGDMVVGQIDDR